MQRMNNYGKPKQTLGSRRRSTTRRGSGPAMGSRMTRELPPGGRKPSASRVGSGAASTGGRGGRASAKTPTRRGSVSISGPRTVRTPRPRPINRPATGSAPVSEPRPMQGRTRPRPMPRRRPGMMQRPVNRRPRRMR